MTFEVSWVQPRTEWDERKPRSQKATGPGDNPMARRWREESRSLFIPHERKASMANSAAELICRLSTHRCFRA